jgi:hypothetical protein
MRGPTTKSGRPTFARMDESTRDHWSHIAEESVADWPNVADRFLAMLRDLEPVTNGFAVNQLVHAALCHDIAKAVSEPNHPATAAALLKPYVRPDVEWMVRVHQDFQGRHYYGFMGKDPDAREQYRGHPAFALAEQFADEWDQTAFDPDYDTLPLEHFEPMVREVFGRWPRRGDG